MITGCSSMCKVCTMRPGVSATPRVWTRRIVGGAHLAQLNHESQVSASQEHDKSTQRRETWDALLRMFNAAGPCSIQARLTEEGPFHVFVQLL
jgi:hypothetical protein